MWKRLKTKKKHNYKSNLLFNKKLLLMYKQLVRTLQLVDLCR